MSDADAGAAGSRRAWCARWLGLDHNPLRRPADRIEAALRVAVLLLIFIAVPVATVMAGRAADHIFLRDAQAQQASRHHVSAVLTQPAPASGSAIDPYVTVQNTWAPARWTAPDGAPRSGQVFVPAGMRTGSSVPVWISASGAITDPPAGHGDVIAEVGAFVVVTGVVLIVVLLSGQALARCVLDRRRLRAWDAEWRATGPLWTGHRT
jgi:hypothetical protein